MVGRLLAGPVRVTGHMSLTIHKTTPDIFAGGGGRGPKSTTREEIARRPEILDQNPHDITPQHSTG